MSLYGTMVGNPGLISQRSIMDRIIDVRRQASSPCFMLTTQYRMHPDVSNLVSQLFYDNKLITDAKTGIERCANGNEVGLLWHSYARDGHVEAYKSGAKSRVFNECEVDMARVIFGEERKRSRTATIAVSFESSHAC